MERIDMVFVVVAYVLAGAVVACPCCHGDYGRSQKKE